MAEQTDFDVYDLYDGTVAIKFGCELTEDGKPYDNIYFQILEVLQENGYDLTPLVGRMSERRFWEEYNDSIERIIEEFGLESEEARAEYFAQKADDED
jgi:hypothetical protein